MRKKTGLACVGCGSPYADKGSMQHPYCKKCFERTFGTGEQGYKNYDKFMAERHPFGLPPYDYAHPDKLTMIIGDMRMVLWKWGLGPDNCPYCGSELMEHGFTPYGYFTCQGHKDCPFNDDYKKWMKEWKERNG